MSGQTFEEAKDLRDFSDGAENVIEWIRGDKTATLQLSGHSKLCNKVRKYAAEHPEEVSIVGTNADGSIVAHIPLSYVKITRPPERNLSDEEREALRERLKTARENRDEESIAMKGQR